MRDLEVITPFSVCSLKSTTLPATGSLVPANLEWQPIIMTNALPIVICISVTSGYRCCSLIHDTIPG